MLKSEHYFILTLFNRTQNVYVLSKFEKLKIEKQNENRTMMIQKGNSYYRHKSSARGPWFKVSSEGLSTEIDILIRSPIQLQTV